MLVHNEHAADLGRLVQMHKAGRDVWAALIVGILLTGIGLFASLRGGAQPYFFLAATTIGLLLLFFWWRHRDDELRVHQCGIFYRTKGYLHALRWHEIAEVYHRHRTIPLGVSPIPVAAVHIPIGTFYRCALETTDGRLVLADNIERVNDAGQYIQQQTSTLQMPSATEAYNRNETLHFGPLLLSRRHGIANRGDFRPWDQLKSVELRDGYIRVYQKGEWLPCAIVSFASVPNAFVFWNLVQEVLHSSDSSERILQN